jgi:hypothetical protein
MIKILQILFNLVILSSSVLQRSHSPKLQILPTRVTAPVAHVSN